MSLPAGSKFPNGHWQDWANLEAVFKESMTANHGLIPGSKWFKDHGYAGMLTAFYQYGYGSLDDLRREYGIFDLKHCPSCDRVLHKSDFRTRTKQTKHGSTEQFRDHVCKACGQKASADYRKTRAGNVAEIYRRCRGRAQAAGREFNLTKEWIANRLEAIQWKCEVTGMPFGQSDRDGFRSIYSVSADRVDSGKGYTTDNVRFVINWVNIAKQQLSDDLFIELCGKVVDGNRK